MLSRRLSVIAVLLAPLALLAAGCLPQRTPDPGPWDTKRSYFDTAAMRIEYPDVADGDGPVAGAARAAQAPLAFEDPADLPTMDLTLPEAVRMAVSNSPVLRGLGANITQARGGFIPIDTVYDPAITHTNPLGGVDAALADFDAVWNSSMIWNKVDQPQNQRVDPLVEQFQPSAFQQTTGQFVTELAKQTATGASFAARHNVLYDRNNRPTRRFPSDYTGFFEGEWRQPLLRGSGVLYNQITGPNAAVGQYNGVLIARIDSDVSLANFEAAVISLVADVEQAYWELYFAYRNLESQLRGRESALQTLQYEQLRLEVGTGRRDEEAQARSQFYQFQAQVEVALAGVGGLYESEQRLRYLLGLPSTDGNLIKPATDPTTARVVFDWDSALGQALDRRVEIRRQKWNVRRRELELYAARLNRRPNLDFVGQYRWRGLGNHLIGDSDEPRFDNLYDNITDGDFQEWMAGVEMSMPVGYRRASAAIANAQLNLARERALLNETQLRISHDLSDASREVARAWRLLQTNLNRWQADENQVEVLSRRRGQIDPINFLLQAQRLVVTSESDYYRALADYNLALRELHRQKGTLLAYNQVQLAEGPWPAEAMRDAYQRGRFLTPRLHPQRVDTPPPVSAGPFDPSMPVPAVAPDAPHHKPFHEQAPESVPAPESAPALESVPAPDAVPAPEPIPTPGQERSPVDIAPVRRP